MVLHTAVREEDLEIVKQAIAAGVDVNGRDEEQNTPLLLAVNTLTPHLEIVRYLIDHGADIEAQNSEHDRPLIVAARMGGTEAVALLLEAGAQTEYTYKEDYSHLAELLGEEQVEMYKNMPPQTRHAISDVENTDILQLLASVGADLTQLTHGDFLELTKLPYRHKLKGTLAEFEPWARPQFGSKNPEVMNNPHWENMVLCQGNSYSARKRYGWSFETHDGPLWCFQRFGASFNAVTRRPLCKHRGTA